MNADWFRNEINRIAETHFSLKHQLEKCLKANVITAEGRKIPGCDYPTYYDMWRGSFSDRFFDMGTFIRFGSAIEQNLKGYYMLKKGLKTIAELKAEGKAGQNVFQRLMPWTDDNVIELYKTELGYDLTTNPHFAAMQEAMLNRHLYAHNTGLVDETYLKNHQRLTGKDIRSDPALKDYPKEDVYWFRPLNDLTEYINASRKFFGAFPP